MPSDDAASSGTPSFLPSSAVGGVGGAVVAVDVIRAFTTAACAFAAGAQHVYLVDAVEEALAFKAKHPGSVAMGEDHGLRPDGFELPNSPVRALAADLDGRVVVQRTSAGTRGVVAARSADRLWCASLVCASATAASVAGSGLGVPTYVLTGWFDDRPGYLGADDRATAEYIDELRQGGSPNANDVAHAITASDEASRTLALGPEHVDPGDIELAADVDRFDFAMEVTRTAEGLRLDSVLP